jgi:ketosteroid isomerase-like protein
MVVPFLLIICTNVFDQPESAKAVAEIEFAFARLSQETNTVNAFVSFLAEDAVMFHQGIPTNGRQLWESRKPDGTLLNWWPVVADISQSGDMGYTTGPYQFFNKRDDTVPVSNGYYSTIWKKQKNGEWRIKLDLGVTFDAIKELPTALTYAERSTGLKSIKEKIINVDGEYNQLLNNTSRSFDGDFVANNFRIHRSLIGPIVNSTSTIKNFERDKKFRFEQAGGEESSSRDLAYTYGNVICISNGGERKSNYLRVWKNENGKWKIVLDVVTEG